MSTAEDDQENQLLMRLRPPYRRPKILLAGMGAFGREHFATWKKLEEDGAIHLAGIVVKTAEHREQLAAETGIPVHTELTEELLRSVDGIDLATPTHTHAELIRKCLPHTHVLAEKPLAETMVEADRLRRFARGQKHLLMLNHLYRFHPSIIELRKLMKKQRARPRMVTAVMLNPLEPGVERYNAYLELLHPFDMLDALLGAGGKVIFTQQNGHAHLAGVRYPDGTLCNVKLGWAGGRRIRTIEVEYEHTRLSADLQDASVLVHTRDRFNRIVIEKPCRTLESSLRTFASAIGKRGQATEPGVETAHRVLKLSLSAPAWLPPARPRVAIIGGGIFGVSCAIELAPHCEVVLFERHAELLAEATFHNQWRHHSGFHYPRSLETVREIQSTRDDFHAMYGSQVIQQIVSYYFTSASAREITRERYLDACAAGGLDFTIVDPPAGIVDPAQVDLCIRTDEGVFQYYRLREEIERRLDQLPNCELRRQTTVTNAEWGKGGQKMIQSQHNGKSRREHFDFIVNASYANLNLLAKWLGFPVQQLRFDLCEMVLLELPLDPICVTVLDGPFTSMVGTGRPGEFLLSHIHESVLATAVTPDGLPPDWKPSSNRRNLIRQCSRYLPVVADARILGSRFATRAVRAFSNDYDGRPTVITDHGFGCWSVLGGKIVTSVSNARSIAAQILCGSQGQR
jgi:predicted dehydrogenase/glycine/D-amino acid oxidase-like deaminating enzyme